MACADGGTGRPGPRAGFIGSGEAMGGFQVLAVVFVSGSPRLFPFGFYFSFFPLSLALGNQRFHVPSIHLELDTMASGM